MSTVDAETVQVDQGRNGAGRDPGTSPTDFVVLVVEDDERPRADFLARLAKLPDVVAIGARTKVEAVTALAEHCIDAAILDLDLGGQMTGLDVLDEMAVSAPRAVAVIATTKLGSDKTLGPRFIAHSAPRIVRVVDKTEEARAAAIEPIEDAVQAWRKTGVTLHDFEMLTDRLWLRRRRIGMRAARSQLDRETERLCRDLFGSIRELEEIEPDVSVTFKELDSEGLSSAVTLLANVTLGKDGAGETVHGTRCVIKVGPMAEIREEVERYERFVKFGVRLAQRVEFLGSSSREHLGAVCYSFAGGVFGQELKTLDKILRAEDGGALAEATFRRLLDTSPENKNWYDVDCGELSPREYLQATYHTNFDECYRILHNSLENLVGKLPAHGFALRPAEAKVDGHLRFEGGKLTIPHKEFLGGNAIWSGRPACLVHGDMHGGNVMVELAQPEDPSVGPLAAELLERVCLIDYRSAGPGPRPIDIIALQASVRLADAHEIAAAATELEGKAPTGDQLCDVLKVAANRVHAERRLLESGWANPPQASEAPHGRPRWERPAQLSIELMRENFKDMTSDEYLASAVPCALRQCSFDVALITRVRMLAWLSALYDHLQPSCS